MGVRSQGNFQQSVSPATTWVPGTTLRSSGSEARVLCGLPGGSMLLGVGFEVSNAQARPSVSPPCLVVGFQKENIHFFLYHLALER